MCNIFDKKKKKPVCVSGSGSIEQRQGKGETLVSLISSNWEEISRKLGCMNLNVDHLSVSNTKMR
ncbi:hypothetical protein HanLR1_Chr06g0206851 [Helianthus annuus]|nr:hypothetical protein HanLR1_Chr10g0355691 [Helianthus annuus]KAJ0737425.1 hypothetical protein HanLR1_Chr06g0206851 [Helianthus annuus]